MAPAGTENGPASRWVARVQPGPVPRPLSGSAAVRARLNSAPTHYQLVEEGAVWSCRTAPRRVRREEASRSGRLAVPRALTSGGADSAGAAQHKLMPDTSAWLRGTAGAEGAQLPTGAGKR